MKEHALLRIKLLKALLDMEEKLMADFNQEDISNEIRKHDQDDYLFNPQSDCMLKSVYTVKELSDYLGVSTDSIYAMVRENQLPYIRVRRRILFHGEAIQSWIKVTNAIKIKG